MFLSTLDLGKQISFLRVADNVAVADGRLIDSERQILLQYAEEMNLEEKAKPRVDLAESLSGEAGKENSSGEGRLVQLLVSLGALRHEENEPEPGSGLDSSGHYLANISSLMSQATGRFEQDNIGVSERSKGKTSKGVGDWTFSLDDALRNFEDNYSQKILVLEVLAIVYANDEYHEKQKEVMEYIINFFGLTPELVTVYSEWAKSMVSLQKQGHALLQLS
jgi:DnaJ-domain-containing protein 1